MGYYTSHTLKIHEGNKTIQEVLEELGEEFDNLYCAVDENGDSYDAIKWYKHEDDMRQISSRYPDLVFALHGEGEEAEDVWYEYYKNGKVQSCPAKITFDEYDEEKLR